MKANIRARYNAYALALAHLREHEALTRELPALAAAYESAKKLLDQLVEAQNRRTQRQASATLAKSTLYEELADEAFSIAVLITSYAASKEDAVLAEEVNFPRSSLDRALPNDLEARATIIRNKATELGEALKPFGLDAARLSAYAALISEFSTGKLAPRRYIAERRDATLQVEDLIKQLAAIFDEQLDGLMHQLRKSQPDFYSQYLIKRTIVQPGNRKTQVLGTLTEKGSSSPIVGATISIKGSTLATQTGADGTYTLFTAPFSGAILVFEKEGYRPVEITADIIRGRATRQSVEMEKI
ncbi:MAG: carboxypeptidase-like regulatory domain-containing protein [Bacteroidetes bacterium]|nr:carboxypeptidase-like regulatory domain-containing protein [Bacteroidota bacterium]